MKTGKFKLCDKGTVLLDEVAELSANLQAKLLHVLQDKKFFRLRRESMIDTDVRVLASTRKFDKRIQGGGGAGVGVQRPNRENESKRHERASDVEEIVSSKDNSCLEARGLFMHDLAARSVLH
jgi:hypothetical protein